VIVVHVDGLCEPNRYEGVATYGVISRKETGELVGMSSGVIGEGRDMSNQVAEYVAVIEALRDLAGKLMTNEEIVVYTDSQLVANQMTGVWKAVHGKYLPYFLVAKQHALSFKNLKFQWIPREENKEADALTCRAYEAWMLTTRRTPKYHGKATKPL
jgi:ribonuclease HI